jgi:hypothetical protein
VSDDDDDDDDDDLDGLTLEMCDFTHHIVVVVVTCSSDVYYITY